MLDQADSGIQGKARERSKPSRREIDALGDAIAETAAHLDAATHRLLTHIREFDEAGGWGRQGALSCAHWLSWRVGLSPGVARERVRVARALGNLPRIDAALSRGEISYCKVRAISRVATPEIEETLLDMAKHATGAELEKICRLYRSVQGAENAASPGEDERRYVQTRTTDDGMVKITAVVTPDEAARITKAIDTAAQRVSAETEGRGKPLSRPDGLTHLAEPYLRGDKPDRAPIEVVLTTPRAALSKRPGPVSAETPPILETAPVSAETARRLACDAGVIEVETDVRGTPLNVGRKTRAIHPALRRALHLRDGGCAFPGCSNHRFVDAHHIVHWADGGDTALENLVLLCRSHHTLIHEAGFSIEATAAGFSFRDPEGRPLPHAAPRKTICAETLLCAHAARGLHIDPDTNMPAWSGEPPDYAACIEALLTRALPAGP